MVSDAKVATYVDKKRFGFAVIENSSEEDYYIPFGLSKGAMNGDKILILPEKQRSYGTESKEAKVIRILERKTEYLVGKIVKFKKIFFVEPIDKNLQNIRVLKKNMKVKVDEGDFVKCKIVKYAEFSSDIEIDIVEKIADKSLKDNAYVQALYSSYDLKSLETFNKNVQEEVKKIDTYVKESDEKGREDRTKDVVFTIDDDDSKDFDDAVGIKKNKDGSYVLSVYIADVSHYVKAKSALDKEAIERGTSIYIPGTVLPMLPKELSNGICSLNEGVKRLVLGIDMHIDKDGNILDDEIFKGVIVSKKRMTYNNVYKFLNNMDTKIIKEYKPFEKELKNMRQLAEILNKKRMREGSINFNLPEVQVELNEDGSVKDVHEYKITFANNMIEEFMLAANRTIAEKFCHLDAPFIYRIHENPDEDKLLELNKILKDKKKAIKNVCKVSPLEISKLLEELKEDEDSQAISNLILRALKVAKYSNECSLHFGLNFKYYCHFTSPIRRYPDLFIHRVISEYLENGYVLEENSYKNYSSEAIKYAITSSEMEKRATKIERDFDDLYMTLFMQDKKGKIYEGVISSVTPFGMFVKLETGVEGLVSVRSLNGYYDYDENKRTLQRGGTKYYIGKKVKIKVAGVDIRAKEIDFEIV